MTDEDIGPWQLNSITSPPPLPEVGGPRGGLGALKFPTPLTTWLVVSILRLPRVFPKVASLTAKYTFIVLVT